MYQRFEVVVSGRLQSQPICLVPDHPDYKYRRSSRVRKGCDIIVRNDPKLDNMFHHRQIEVGADGRMGAAAPRQGIHSAPWPEQRAGRDMAKDDKNEKASAADKETRCASTCARSAQGFRRTGATGPREERPSTSPRAGPSPVRPLPARPGIAAGSGDEGFAGAPRGGTAGAVPRPAKPADKGAEGMPIATAEGARQWPWQASPARLLRRPGLPHPRVAWRLSTLTAGTASLQLEHSEDGEDWEALSDPFTPQRGRQVRGQR